MAKFRHHSDRKAVNLNFWNAIPKLPLKHLILAVIFNSGGSLDINSSTKHLLSPLFCSSISFPTAVLCHCQANILHIHLRYPCCCCCVSLEWCYYCYPLFPVATAITSITILILFVCFFFGGGLGRGKKLKCEVCHPLGAISLVMTAYVWDAICKE